MRQFISKVFIIALLALAVFNAWQISSLKKEVADLNEKIAVLKVHNSSRPTSEDAATFIGKARKHADKARKEILAGNVGSARSEIEKSLQLMQKAGHDAGAPSSEALERAQRTLQDTRKSIEGLWQKMEQEPKKSKGG